MFTLRYFTEFEIATPTLEVFFVSYLDALKDINTYAIQNVWETKKGRIRAEILQGDRVVFRCEF